MIANRGIDHIHRRAANVVFAASECLSQCSDAFATIRNILHTAVVQLSLNVCVLVEAGEGCTKGASLLSLSGAPSKGWCAVSSQLSWESDVVVDLIASGQIAISIPNSPTPLYIKHGSILAFPENVDAVCGLAVPICAGAQCVGILVTEMEARSRANAGVVLWVLCVLSGLIGQIWRTCKEAKWTLTGPDCNAMSTNASNGEIYGILGSSREIQSAIRKALRAAQSQATVLLTGESGSGKERFARMIHLASDRRDQAFICLNCAAIPRELLESELFGHVRGSFTGATSDRIGKFELASTGTLFLDEIGDMPLVLQSKLLRALQERTIQRIGSGEEMPVNPRIIAATNCNLEERVAASTFRLDLFFRLNVLRVNLPPVRERYGDIQTLTQYFLSRDNQRYSRNVKISPAAMVHLESYDWPGNVRQLENVVERLVILSEADLIEIKDVINILSGEAKMPNIDQIELRSEETKRELSMIGSVPIRGYLKVNEDDRDQIEQALRSTHGNKTMAARRLGMTPRQFNYRVLKLGIM